MNIKGKCSWFGGPSDTGVSPSEGLAFIYEVEDAPHLFLPSQPPGTTGLARRLDPGVFYVACRWDYDQYPKPSLLEHLALVRSTKNGRQYTAYPADWGPNSNTGRVADISPGLMEALGITTDDEVEVFYPYEDLVEVPIMPTYERVVISSGHGKLVRGASGVLDEVDEARKVVDRVAEELRERGVNVAVFHDDTSTSQSQNLNAITTYHNQQTRDLDISVHFNAYVETSKPMGTEVLYVTQLDLADQMSAAIAANGFIDRGPKKRTDLAFLNNTDEPAILLEVCFVDSEADASVYRAKFSAICDSIAGVIGGAETTEPPVRPDRPERPPPVEPPADIPRVDIQVSGEVLVFVNGTQVGTKG